MKTRFAAKSKEEVIWAVWVHRNPNANHQVVRTRFLGAVNLGLPMSHIIGYLNTRGGPRPSQAQPPEGEQS